MVIGGCAHRGIINICRKATELTGKAPDVVVSGFHLFELGESDPQGDALIARMGTELLAGETVYYTGHCTGAYAYELLKNTLGERLQPMCGGTSIEI